MKSVIAYLSTLFTLVVGIMLLFGGIILIGFVVIMLLWWLYDLFTRPKPINTTPTYIKRIPKAENSLSNPICNVPVAKYRYTEWELVHGGLSTWLYPETLNIYRELDIYRRYDKVNEIYEIKKIYRDPNALAKSRAMFDATPPFKPQKSKYY